MHPIRSGATVVATALALVVCGGSALAFHSGGVGDCGGCHVSHDTRVPEPGPNLLRGANSTDTCLRCHEIDAGNTWGAGLLNPGPVYGGGSFVFLLEDNLNDGSGGSDPANWISGNHAGHNVISPAFGTGVDPDHATAPGGTYPSMHLTCTSCHDPHDKAGNFRMLYGSNSPASRSDGYLYTYSAPAPRAEGIALDGPPESNGGHTAYQAGWTDWCAECHDRFHDVGGSAFDHPVRDNLGGDERSNYDGYDGTGFWTSGDPLTSYIPQLTYQSPSVTPSFTGPTPSDAEVTCLSCHRAHASSAPYAGRWDFNIATWASEGIVSGSYAIPNPYETTAGPDQRRLCEKCHGQNVPN